MVLSFQNIQEYLTMQSNLALVLILGVTLLSSMISGGEGVIGPFPTVRRPKVKRDVYNDEVTCTHGKWRQNWHKIWHKGYPQWDQDLCASFYFFAIHSHAFQSSFGGVNEKHFCEQTQKSLPHAKTLSKQKLLFRITFIPAKNYFHKTALKNSLLYDICFVPQRTWNGIISTFVYPFAGVLREKWMYAPNTERSKLQAKYGGQTGQDNADNMNYSNRKINI